MKSEKYLDAIMTKLGKKRDKDLAVWLEMSPQMMSMIRKGERFLDNNQCLKIALELDIEPWKVIMAADTDRAEKTGQRSLWENFLQKMGVTNNSTDTQTEASPRLNQASGQICIM